MSDIIQLLPESVANQIAAGEVVQRPASVVKELVENAIDAGADKIRLVVGDAGKSLIQVIDNGCGMGASDARRSLERHATSKIRRAEDLFGIRTMGFRGEALASIAAVAQVELKTRRHGDELGTVLEVADSAIVSEEAGAVPEGTGIRVRNLFYNIPARRHFLKSNAVEMKHIIDEFQRVALAHPSIHFSLHSDGQEIYHLPAGPLKQRIVHVFGNSYNQRLVPVGEETSIIGLRGFIGKPEFAKKTRGEQFLFVNKRFVRDAYIHHAIMGAYQEVLPDGAYPLYILFIDIDPAKIDINVHPTKTEIKFVDEKSIYAIVRSAVKRSLGQFHITPSLDFDQETGFSRLITPIPLEELNPPEITFNPDFNPFGESPGQGSGRTGFRDPGGDRVGAGDNGSGSRSGIPSNWESLYEITQRVEPRQLSLESGMDQIGMEADDPGAGTDGNAVVKSASSRLFQLHKRFIVSQIPSGFILIDQQAAHERILYEQFLQQLETRQGSSQQSLFPQTISLQPADTGLLRELLPEIQSLGFQLREFGKNTFVVEGFPADLGAGSMETAVIEQLLEDYKNNRSDLQLPKRAKLAKSLAQSASMKAGTELSPEEMGELIDKLFACESANVSIQGKPVILTFTLEELLARFDP